MKPKGTLKGSQRRSRTIHISLNLFLADRGDEDELFECPLGFMIVLGRERKIRYVFFLTLMKTLIL